MSQLGVLEVYLVDIMVDLFFEIVYYEDLFKQKELLIEDGKCYVGIVVCFEYI